MLEKVRKPKRAKNIIAYIIFGAICLVFVFMGDIPNQFGLSVGGPAAVVNKEPISFADYRETYSRMQNQYKGQLDFLPAAQRQLYMNNLRSQALENLINSQVVSQAAKDLGLYVSDEEVRDYIVKIPAFKEEERFRRERYDNYLRYRKISAEKFEKEIRKEVTNTQVRNLMQMSLGPSEASSGLGKQLERLKVNLSFAKISDTNFSSSAEVKDAELSSFVSDEANQSAIKDYFTANKTNYQEEEEVQARHILIKFDAAKAGNKEKALSKIQGLKKRLATEDFAKLAKEFSDDPGSKVKGGDLGFFGKGRMVPAFEKVAFSAKVGDVSEPVESQFGYHLIKVEAKKAAVTKVLADVKSEVAKELIKENKVKAERERVQAWVSGGEQKPLNSWLKKQKVKWQDTGEFKLNATSIPKVSLEEKELFKVLKVAASGEKWVNELLKVGGQSYVIKVKAYREEKLKALPKAISSKLDFRKGQIVSDVFKTWADQKKEISQIERNPQVLAR